MKSTIFFRKLRSLPRFIYRKTKNITRKITFNFVKKKNIKELLNLLIENQNKTVIIFENNFGWNGIMKQRPQQIASNFNNNTIFVYGGNDKDFSGFKRVKKLKSNLYLVDLVVYKKMLHESLKNTKSKYLMIYSTDYIPYKLIDSYYQNDFKIIYEYVDDIDEKLCGKETAALLKERQQQILELNNLFVVTTASKLYNNIKNHKKDVNLKLVTNGADYEHFSQVVKNVPEDAEKYISKNKINIGYYGALASWFDYDLLIKLADANSKYNIVLIGLDYDRTLSKSKILDHPQIHYLGKKDYDDLPGYLKIMDVAVIPFVINEVTLSTSPVKVFEYMASGTPIVTTALPECEKYKSVLIGESHDDFIKKIAQAIKLKKQNEYVELLKKEALDNAWEEKCEEIINFLNEV